MLDADGYVVTRNSGAERFHRYQAVEVIGKHLSSFYPQKDIENHQVIEELQIAINQGKCVKEKICLRQDGSLFRANVITTALYDQQKQLHGFFQVTQDIIETKESVVIKPNTNSL